MCVRIVCAHRNEQPVLIETEVKRRMTIRRKPREPTENSKKKMKKH